MFGHSDRATDPQATSKNQTVRVGTQYTPAPIRPRGRPSATRTAERTQRSSTFPRRIGSHADRCSRFTRQGRAE